MKKSSAKDRRRTWLLQAGRIVAYAGCSVVSVLLLLSGYESIFNRDLPLVHTLDSVDLRAVSQRYDLAKAAQPSNAMYGNFGKPQNLKLPERTMRMNIVPPVSQTDGKWLARTSTLHLLIARPPRNGNIGLALLYCRASFRTISQQNLPTDGDNIFMDTDKNWRYVYKVTSAKLVPADTSYIISDDGSAGKLAIVCNDQKSHTDFVVEATLLTVQGLIR